MTETARQLVDGYRALADFIEAHPDGLAWPVERPTLTLYREADTAENVARVARLLAPVTKEFKGKILYLTRQVSQSSIVTVGFFRDAVCTKRVIGTKRVEARYIPAHDEELVEWDCGPILGEAKPEPAEQDTP